MKRELPREARHYHPMQYFEALSLALFSERKWERSNSSIHRPRSLFDMLARSTDALVLSCCSSVAMDRSPAKFLQDTADPTLRLGTQGLDATSGQPLYCSCICIQLFYTYIESSSLNFFVAKTADLMTSVGVWFRNKSILHVLNIRPRTSSWKLLHLLR